MIYFSSEKSVDIYEVSLMLNILLSICLSCEILLWCNYVLVWDDRIEQLEYNCKIILRKLSVF